MLDSSTKTASVTYTSSNYYSNNTYSGDITIPASVNYSGTTYSVTSIGLYAFCACNRLTSITIPESVTIILDYAFLDCIRLTSVTINNNNIVSKAYKYNSNLSNIFGSQVTTYILGDNVTSIGDYAFRGCTGLTSITIPNSVTSIGERAFQSCTGLTSITIPESVTSIGDYAFEDCTGLTSITIPNSVTSIGGCAFSGCKGLTSITIPSSVTSIEVRAFAGCTGLTSITIPSSVTSIGSYAFSYCSGLTSITACKMEPSEYNCTTNAFGGVPYSSVTLYVPSGSASAYGALEPWSNFSSNIVETDLTSIQTPTISSSETIVGYYNLQGQRITNPQRGQLVIVRESDGRSRKVVMK